MVLVISEEVSVNSQDNLKVIKIHKFKKFMLQRPFQVLAYAFATIKYRNDFDIVFSRLITPENIISDLVAKKLLKKKIVVCLPGSSKTGKSLRLWIYRVFLKLTLKNADAIIASSESVQKYYQKSYKKYMNHSKLFVIRPPVNIERFNSDSIEKSLDILCVSRINPIKSIETIIEAIPYIIKSTPKVKLKIVGPIQDNQYYDTLKNLVSKLRCENNVDFVGPVPYEKITEYYNLAKTFIMTGKEEGQANSTLEAMACGIPVIVTPSGILPELIQDGVNGFLIDYNQPEILAKKISLLLSDEQYRQKIGREARNTIEKKHGNWDMYVDNYISLFAKLKD